MGVGVATCFTAMRVRILRILLSWPKAQDTIQDFSDGTDYIQLGEGLSFGDLKIASRGSSTSIEIADSGEVLAILSGIDNQQISDLDFV